MTLAHALHTMHQHWRALPHASTAGHAAVWIRMPPTEALVEEEWVGIPSDGTMVWAWASRGAAAPGPQETQRAPALTVVQGERTDLPQPWHATILRCAEACSPGACPLLCFYISPRASPVGGP